MRSICVIGLHLLLLNHMVQSFVLLTANIDDIKKLAKKFVSESLAEKIADFIARATEQIITNVSNENEEGRYQDISKENRDSYNIARQRHPKEAKARSRRPTLTSRTPKTRKETLRHFRPKKFGAVNLKNAANVTEPKRQENFNDNKIKMVDQYSYTIKERNRPKIDLEEPQSTEIPHLDSTIGVAEKIMRGEPELKSKFLSPSRFRLTSNSKENGTIEPFDFENIQKSLSTRKERNEFDQYDNPNYPKSVLIATSGPVVLPKIPSDDWWGKENENNVNGNKNWE